MTEKPEQGGMLLPDEAAPMLEAAVMGDDEALKVAAEAWDTAHPVETLIDDAESTYWRMEIATRAMQTFIPDPFKPVKLENIVHPEDVARWAFDYADAMMAEAERRK